MYVYAVFREGIFRKQCGGIFRKFNDALNEAKKLINLERDNFCHYEVIRFRLDETHKTEIAENELVIYEPEANVIVRKNEVIQHAIS